MDNCLTSFLLEQTRYKRLTDFLSKYLNPHFTCQGQILKIVNTNSAPAAVRTPVQPVLVEELQVLQYGDPVLGIKITTSGERSERRVVVTASTAVLSLPLQRCHVAASCSSCVALQDPHCGWDLVSSKCVSQNTFNSVYASEFLQNITVGRHRQCGDSESSVLIEEFKVKHKRNGKMSRF